MARILIFAVAQALLPVLFWISLMHSQEWLCYSFTGTDPDHFAVSSTTCGVSLGAKARCTISVAFTPTAIGTRTATLNVNDSVNNSPQTVSLTGTGK